MRNSRYGEMRNSEAMNSRFRNLCTDKMFSVIISSIPVERQVVKFRVAATSVDLKLAL